MSMLRWLSVLPIRSVGEYPCAGKRNLIVLDVKLTLHHSFFLSTFSAAEDDPNCSIYGMPVLRVWKSANVFVLKRSIGNAGYTGMQNPVLYKDNTHVLLGDAKDTCEELRTEICKN